MIAVVILAIILFPMIYCLAVLKLGWYKNPTWYKVGFATPAWFLFLYIVIEAMVYMGHINDDKALSRYNYIVNELRDEEGRSKTVFKFMVSKYPGLKDMEISEIKDERSFFAGNPDLATEGIPEALADFLGKKRAKEDMEVKIDKIKKRMLHRINSPWVLILPDTDNN